MTDERLRIYFGGATQLLVTVFVGTAWIMKLASSTEALIPLLALGGMEIVGRKGIKTPPPGPTTLVLFFALQAFQPFLA